MDKLKIFMNELQSKIGAVFLLDIRTKKENEIARIPNSLLIPIDELEKRYKEISKDKEIVVYCHHGNRSLIAAEFLQSKGYNARSLVGGIDAWSRFIDNSILQY
jgi:adenylyltransferase/sulfurtransferase